MSLCFSLTWDSMSLNGRRQSFMVAWVCTAAPSPQKKSRPMAAQLKSSFGDSRFTSSVSGTRSKSEKIEVISNQAREGFLYGAYNGSGSLLLKNEPMKLWPLHCEPPSLRCLSFRHHDRDRKDPNLKHGLCCSYNLGWPLKVEHVVDVMWCAARCLVLSALKGPLLLAKTLVF